MRRSWIAVLLLAGCSGSDAPYCGEFVDITGRPAAFCPGPRDQPVCDRPGESAHFDEGPLGLELRGGDYASCNLDFEVICPTGTVGAAYCIRDPEI